MDASEIHPRRIDAREGLTPQRGDDLIFPKIVRKGPRIPRAHSKAGTTCREWKNFKANRKGLNRQNQKVALKPGKTSGRFKVTSSSSSH